MVVLIFLQLTAIIFHKHLTIVQVSVVLIINTICLTIFFFHTAIVTGSSSSSGFTVDTRSTFGSALGQQKNFGNDFASTSVLTQSTSAPIAFRSNDLAQTQVADTGIVRSSYGSATDK